MSDALLPQQGRAVSAPLRVGASRVVVSALKARTTRFAIAMLWCHLTLEYLRPQTFWPPLGALQLPAIALTLLLIATIPQLINGATRFAGQTWLLLGFLGLSTLSILYAANWFRAYKFTYAVALAVIAYLAIAHLLRDERDFKNLLTLLVVIHVYLSFGGILAFSRSQFNEAGYASTGYVGGGFLKDENDFALAINVVLPLALYLAAQARSRGARLLSGLACAVLVLTSVFTFSRGGFIGLAAMTIYWVVTSTRKTRAVGLLVLGIVLVLTVAPTQYWDRISTIGDIDQGTAWERQRLWTGARLMFYDSPLWGVGAANYGVQLPDYAFDWEPDRRMNLWGKAVHSLYFQLLAEFGLLGLALIAAILVLNFRSLTQVVRVGRRRKQLASLALLASSLRASWVGFLVSAAFLSVLEFPHLYYLTAFTVALHRLALARAGVDAVEPQQSR